MGFSSEQHIAEANRNEAIEAYDKIGAVREEILLEWGNTDDDEEAEVLKDWAAKLWEAMELVHKYSDKHQPDVQRWK